MSMAQWVELCTAVGINVRNLELMDVFQLGGKIMRDDLLFKKQVGSGKTSIEVIAEMSQAERVSLRERVTGVIQFRKK